MALKVYSQDYSQYHGQYWTTSGGLGHLNDSGRYGGGLPAGIPGVVVPVGLQKPSLDPSGPWLPQVVPGTGSISSTTILAPTSGQNQPPVLSVVPPVSLKPFYVSKPLSWEQEQKMNEAGYEVIVRHPNVAPAPAPVPAPAPIPVVQDLPATPPIAPTAPTTSTGGNMPLDLGGLLNTAAEAWIAKEFAPQPVAYAPTQTIQPIDYNVGPLNLDPFDLFTDPVTGQQVMRPKKKCRRRRKRLATVSDIKDLAALKAVLGNGEAFKTWIATHS